MAGSEFETFFGLEARRNLWQAVITNRYRLSNERFFSDHPGRFPQHRGDIRGAKTSRTPSCAEHWLPVPSTTNAHWCLYSKFDTMFYGRTKGILHLDRRES